MALTNIRSINGANALVKVDNKTLGYATGVTVNEVYGLQRIDVLGEIDSRDIEPIGRVVNVQISFIRMTPNPASGSQDGNRGGGSAQRGLVPHAKSEDDNQENTEIVTRFFEDGFDLDIFDSGAFESDEPELRYTIVGCRPSSQSFAITRGTLMGVNVTCEALRIVEKDFRDTHA